MVNFAFQDVEHPYPHNTLTPADFKDNGWPIAVGPVFPQNNEWLMIMCGLRKFLTNVGYFSFFSLSYEDAQSTLNIASTEPPLKTLPDSYDVCSLPYWFRKNGLETNIVKLDEILKTDENFVYYFTLVTHEQVKWFEHVNFNSFSIELISAINSGQCSLVINDAMESTYFSRRTIDKFTANLRSSMIKPDKVTVITGSGNYLYNELPFKLVHWGFNESLTSEFIEDFEIKKSVNAKKFLCLNLFPKAERLHFMYEMYKNNILDQFNFSLYMGDTKGKDDFHDGKFPWPWNEDIEDFALKSPYTLEKEEQQEASHHINMNVKGPYFSLPKFHAEDNLLYIVTESIFNYCVPFRDNGMTRDVSEKTWKPIALKMPFIIIGQPFGLKRLREFGYKTFHTLWNEDYDNILDERLRMHSIVDLVVSLSKRKDFKEMIESCRDIVEHNFKLFKLRSPEQEMIKEVASFSSLDFIKARERRARERNTVEI